MVPLCVIEFEPEGAGEVFVGIDVEDADAAASTITIIVGGMVEVV